MATDPTIFSVTCPFFIPVVRSLLNQDWNSQKSCDKNKILIDSEISSRLMRHLDTKQPESKSGVGLARVLPPVFHTKMCNILRNVSSSHAALFEFDSVISSVYQWKCTSNCSWYQRCSVACWVMSIEVPGLAFASGPIRFIWVCEKNRRLNEIDVRILSPLFHWVLTCKDIWHTTRNEVEQKQYDNKSFILYVHICNGT